MVPVHSSAPARRAAIIGGGAAGVFAAVALAEEIRALPPSERTRVVIIEATGEPLDKVRISGGGRCNVTHHCFDPAEMVKNYPRGHRELRGPFSRFQPRDTVAWFERHGVRLKVEPDGRMFPVTDSSQTIIDCLLHTARDLGIELRFQARVKEIRSNSESSGRFVVERHDGSQETFDQILLATGSSPQGYRMAQALGHTIVPTVPSLFTFKVSDPRLTDLSGISFEQVHLTLIAGKQRFEQTGPMLITHWGLSGPAVLKLSAWGARELHDARYRADLRVNFAPASNREQIYDLLVAHKQAHGRRQVSGDSPVPLPKRYWARVVKSVGIGETTPWTDVTKLQMTTLAQEITAAQFPVKGKGVFKEEFVTCGGVDLREVDFRTMQSKLRPGIFFAGEVLDIDGITGGFNFQNAWTTGWIAGKSMAERP